MWAGRRTGKGKGQRDRVGKTSIRTESFQARVTDLDPIRVSPYGPAACHLPHREAGHTTAPDRMHRADQKLLASTGASTHVRPNRGGSSWAEVGKDCCFGKRSGCARPPLLRAGRCYGAGEARHAWASRDDQGDGGASHRGRGPGHRRTHRPHGRIRSGAALRAGPCRSGPARRPGERHLGR